MAKRVKSKLGKTLNFKKTKVESEVVRCKWVTKDPLYISYHDNEWGNPEFNSKKLFEILCLEGQQAGLSWIIVLKKRENYRKLFYNFNPSKVLELSEKDIDILLRDPGVIRHRGKLESIVHNAKCYLKMKSEGIDFSQFIWSFVDKTPMINSWKNFEEVPTQTEISTELSSALKKRGFKFVGSTICYAFMQASGLVNDHIDCCICRKNKNNK